MFFLLVVMGSFSMWAEEQIIPSPFELALIQHESRGDDKAIGDKNLSQKAYGCLQIRQPACDDINQRYGTNYRAEDCLGNRDLSLTILRLYIRIWATEKNLERQPTLEDYARIWNGGPKGHLKTSTKQYWQDVQDIYGQLLATQKK